MKKIVSILPLIFLFQVLLGQVGGNINYQKQATFPANNYGVRLSSSSNIIVSVKGLSNVVADAYIAIFNVSQAGETTDEVNKLLDQRINLIIKRVEELGDLSYFVDMISFVPIYEYEIEKKLFSKDNYTEVPIGFELKKNLHIKYSNPDYLNQLISICASSEIYDLVKVDYVSLSLEDKKKELIAKAKIVLDEKLKYYQEVLNTDITSYERDLADGFKLMYPSEMYKSYKAFSSNSIIQSKSSRVNQANKSTTQYYQPIVNKDFDFVVNPIIVEPVIQIVYELKLRIKRENNKSTSKEYILITPTGELKTIKLRE